MEGKTVRQRTVASPSSPTDSGNSSIEKKGAKSTGAETPSAVPKLVVSATTLNPSHVALFVLTALSFITRFYCIWFPSEVVFDEVHFGKFASYYIRRSYFFDVHPPLAKLLIAAWAYVVGMDGNYLFDKIGESYIENNVSYISLRTFVASWGAAIPVLVYMIMIESGYSVYAALLTGIMLVFDNGLVTHSRFIYLDNFMIVFILCTVFFYVRFFKSRFHPFGKKWWINLALTGIFLGCTVSVKLVGALTIAMIGIVVIVDLWRLLDIQRGLTVQQWGQHFAARALCLIVIPIAVYMLNFYVHFAVVYRSGPGDRYMSPAFQATLTDSPLYANTVDVQYNGNVRLRHKKHKVYMHSHDHHYPLRYPDGRVSSKGQQVNGYIHKDFNNYWTVLPGGINGTIPVDLTGNNTNAVVRNGDVVRLLHVATQSYLYTHDVASPLTSTNMEITTVAKNATDAKYKGTLWRVEIDKKSANTTHWVTEASLVRLVHVQHGVAIFCNNKNLPDWAFQQMELNGSKKPLDEGNVWVANDIEGVDPAKVKKNPRKPKPMNFFLKIFELNRVMVDRNSALTKPHPYQSAAIAWPFVLRGVSYWSNSAERQQIYLLGHPFGWWLGFLSVVCLASLLFANLLATRRGIEPVSPLINRHLDRSAGYILLGYATHYFPFFTQGRALFLHHYLPALIFSYMAVGTLYQYAFVDDYGRFALRSLGSRVRHLHLGKSAAITLAVILVLQVGIFIFFSPLIYGSSLTIDQVLARQWWHGWDFQYLK
ncbi:Dolichyl-phosphate-mannose--protein mannosyltransferase 4 [Dispira simplex]|nr:Dolichyl-phosphate-mannose--protein mannosyltransferase 4 [Dispira simplex]